METLSTLTKIMRVFGCEGRVFHVCSGLVLLRHMKGYVCPYCHSKVYDITDTPVGQGYFAYHRPDKWISDIPSPSGRTNVH